VSVLLAVALALVVALALRLAYHAFHLRALRSWLRRPSQASGQAPFCSRICVLHRTSSAPTSGASSPRTVPRGSG